MSLPLDITEQPEVISGQKVGYARVSSRDQNLDRQIAQLKAEKVFTCYADKRSGGSRERPGLEEAMRYVRTGDQLIFTSMDRCARSLIDLHSIVDELVQRGVSVKFLKEGQTYSKDSTPITKLMLGLLGSIAEFERTITLQIHGSHTTIGEIMATPLTPRTQTSAELRAERAKVVKQMGPLGVDGLRRLRAADALDVKEADLLDRYESLTWLIEG